MQLKRNISQTELLASDFFFFSPLAASNQKDENVTKPQNQSLNIQFLTVQPVNVKFQAMLPLETFLPSNYQFLGCLNY